MGHVTAASQHTGGGQTQSSKGPRPRASPPSACHDTGSSRFSSFLEFETHSSSFRTKITVAQNRLLTSPRHLSRPTGLPEGPVILGIFHFEAVSGQVEGTTAPPSTSSSSVAPR